MNFTMRFSSIEPRIWETVCRVFDNAVVDGAVNGSAWLTRVTASISGFFDYWFVDLAVRRSDLIYYFSFPLRRIQTGVIQNYAALTIGGILLIVGYLMMT